MRVLATGAAGQLGRDLVALCEAEGDDVVGVTRAELDVADAAAVQRVIADVSPEVVVNCAAWTAVDACEADPERAELVNGRAVGFLADACASVGAHLVQISTDYVFDGTKSGAYVEGDATNPQSAYGRSKLLGEQLAGDRATVVRTSWVYSRHGGNMVATLCRLMAEHDTVSFVADQVGHPTHTVDLAVAVRALAADRFSGVVHCTNRGAVSWFEFARAVFAAAGADPERVLPITTAELDPPRPAPRPANSVLDNRLFDSMHQPLPDFRDGLAEVVAAYR